MAVGPGFHVDAQGNLHIGSTRETFDSTTISEAPFSVTKDGSINATTGTFSGNLSAAGGTFSGNLSAAGGTFTGTLSGVDGTFTGTISASNVTGGTLDFSSVTAGNLDFGSLSVTSTQIINAIAEDAILGKISDGAISEAKLGNISATKITSGTMSADRISGGSISGDLISGGTITFGSSIMTSGQHILTGLITISPTTSGSVIGAQNSNVSIRGGSGSFDSLNVDGNAQIDDNLSVDGYVEGDEFRGNNNTVDIHRSGTSNGIRIVGASSGAYLFTYDSGGNSHTLYNPFSDERLKENITDLNYGLEEILQLRPITYDWKDDVRPFPENTELQYGLLAQEVEEVMPAIVNTAPSTHTVIDEDGNETEEDLGVMVDGTLIQNTKSYDERPLTYALINAVQELSAKNDELESRLAALEG